ncbi:MAG: hypothetical protein A2Y95_08210 [Deltaproteobacteria bacterium RBG_13_65_10]|nr:MAG: hypothetical protein A2Y95_08210 [Deltaproteobacteria bacterium RBG_13_65_10]
MRRRPSCPPRILVTVSLPGRATGRLKRLGPVANLRRSNRALAEALGSPRFRKIEGILCTISDPIDMRTLSAAPALRVVSSFGVGLDHVDLEAATRHGVLVCHTPGVLTEATADLAWGLLLDAARRITEGDRLVRGGGFGGYSPSFQLGQEVFGRTLGIVGFGRIGQAVARRARGFGMRVLYASPRRAPRAIERRLGARRASLDTLLTRADFVSLHLPLTRQTRHLIGARALSRMKPTSILVNTARGPVVDERALVHALRAGTIAAAGLDVYEREPLLTPGLARLPNVVLAPHLGSATLQTRKAMADLAVENLIAALRGRRPPHLANPDVFSRRKSRRGAR